MLSIMLGQTAHMTPLTELPHLTELSKSPLTVGLQPLTELLFNIPFTELHTIFPDTFPSLSYYAFFTELPHLSC
jgi:hypothetical protein